jgi:hypothetical protein
VDLIGSSSRADEGRQSSAEKASFFSRFNDVYVDLLGSLLPGLFSVLLGGFMLAFTFSTIYGMVFASTLLGQNAFGFLKDLIHSLHLEISVVTLVLAYIVGSVFFRQDPKRPDENSAVYVWMKSSPEERGGLAVQSEREIPPETRVGFLDRTLSALWPARYARKYNLDTQFPYLYMRCYLGARGLTHLTQYVPWCGGSLEMTKGFRTKMFLNILKIRLQSMTPELCRDVVRNEAHVRLATSVWYSATWLFAVSCFCQLCLAITLGMAPHRSATAFRDTYAPGVTAAFVMALCFVMRSQLRKCIHYMRVREVVYVLEASHLASKRAPDFAIWNLTKKDDANACLRCGHLGRNGVLKERACSPPEK